jgi:sulfur carrier protein
VEILFNGERRQIEPGTTVAALVDQLGLDPRHVAVELNLRVVPRRQHAETPLASDDRVELVTLVGGG